MARRFVPSSPSRSDPNERPTMYPGSIPVRERTANCPALRILLVDDSWAFLGSAEHFLSTEPQLQVVGCASSGREALEQVPLLRPDLVLMAVAMPHLNGLAAGRLIKTMPQGPRVVLLSVNDHPAYRAEAEAIGADAFLSKSDFGSRLVPLIRRMFNLA